MKLSCIIATLCVLLSVLSAPAVTLERLSVDEITDYSTYIVRASVKDSRVTERGPVIYTEYALAIQETLKGALPAETLWVSLPGGTVRSGSVQSSSSAKERTQRFAGVPELRSGPEYLLFLRQGKNGVVQLVGMSQGLFEVEAQGSASAGTTSVGTRLASTAVRPAIDGVLLDRKSGFRVQDRGMRLSLRELRSNIITRGNGGGHNR